MILLISILIAVFKTSHQACGALYPNQTIGQPNPIIYILPPYDDINNKPCGGNYETYASSGNPNQGLGNFQITNFANGKGGTLMIKNTDAIGSVFCVIQNNDVDVKKCQGKVSLTPTVKIIWTQTDLNYIFQFSASLINITAHGPAPNVTTSAPITTRTYTPGYVDPWLISHDLFVAIDAGSKPSIQSYNEMKALANNTLQQFNVINDTFDIAPPAYTRVSMLELTPLDEYVPNGALWSLTNNSIGANLAGMLTYTATPANYTNTLKMAVQQAFKIRQHDNITDPDGRLYAQGTRIHAQRTIMIFTNQVPDDFSNIIASCTNNVDSPTTLCDFFLSYDVRLLIVGYKVSPADNTALSNNWFSYINVTNFDVPTAMQIIGQFFTNADGLCKPRYSKDIVINETRNDTSDPPPYFYEPGYYNGPTMFNNTNIWGAVDGQKYRYCNFHYNRYNILNTAKNTTATPTCLIVFYELEIERDFLRIYELGSDLHDLTEISSLTGKDVLGSVIQSARNLAVIFSTDYMEVYGGFYVYAMTGTNGKCMRPPKIP